MLTHDLTFLTPTPTEDEHDGLTLPRPDLLPLNADLFAIAIVPSTSHLQLRLKVIFVVIRYGRLAAYVKCR
jgi:hypothetical protein